MGCQLLYSEKQVQTRYSDLEISTKQKNAAQKWLDMLNSGKLKSETGNYGYFSTILLRDILQYPEEKINEGRHKHNVEFTISDQENKNIELCIEAKGSDTDLEAYQNKGYGKHKEKPILQAIFYMGNIPANFAIATNYNRFMLFDKNHGGSKCYDFYFKDIEKNPEKLKEFVGIFSYQKLVGSKDKKELLEKTINEEKEISDKFYAIYNETRLMIFKEFFEENNNRKEALEYTQKFLDRLIFLFFIEKKDDFLPDSNIFSKKLFSILESDECSEFSHNIFYSINELFKMLDEGSEVKNIYGYNGGLFRPQIPESYNFSDIRGSKYFEEEVQITNTEKKKLTNEKIQELIKKHHNKLSPIIVNMLIMNSFDFKSDINVNILGHIFEQSINDLEKLEKNIKLQRKKDGIFYTPESLTDFVCRTAIVRRLSNGNATSIKELLEEHHTSMGGLEYKLKTLKILDPSCGSGAFLNKAADILLEIYEEILSYKKGSGYERRLDTESMDSYTDKTRIDDIIENNIFGVDLNPASVSITQLSLFLKLAVPKRKLVNLDKNIKHGNSLIDDPKVDENYFTWDHQNFPNEFPPSAMRADEKINEVLGDDDSGFDVIVGNPPWNIIKPDVDEFFSPLYEGSKKFSLLTKNKKNNFMKECLSDSKIEKDWNDYLENYENQMEYFNNSSEYENQQAIIDGKKQSSDLNLYKLFVEKIQKILKKNGVCGLIIPSGICSDLGSQGLRKLILFENNITDLFSFINKGIFKDVHRQFKFSILIFKKENTSNKFRASFGLTNTADLINEHSHFEYDLELIHVSSPDALSIMECKNKTELSIFEKIYNHPLIGSSEWNIVPKSEFHMTNNSDLFHESKIGYPLYEGKMMNMFEHNFGKPRYWIDKEDGTNHLIQKEIRRSRLDSSQHPRIDSEEFRLVWRTITNATNERGLISTILHPNVFLGNSLNYLEPIKFEDERYTRTFSYPETFYLCGIFNSFPIDFVIRHKISSNLNIFYLKELPIPRYDKNNYLHKKIEENTSKLICTSDEYYSLLDDLEIVEGENDAAIRLTLEAQINACSAKIYDLSRKEFEKVLENFPIVDSKLKEISLEEFDLL